MDNYKNLGGDSGISKYEILNDAIKIKFSTGAIYIYSNLSAGTNNIEKMKSLAKTGKGLNSFIMKNVRTKYVK
jgi:hypothetical protein